MIGNYTVYQHTFPNGKKYIGITSQLVEMRWRKNGEGYKTQKLIERAIKKYGWDNIIHEILYTGLTQEEARQTEIRLISELDLTNPQKGYNNTFGGDIPPRTDRPVYCIEDDTVYPSILEASRQTGIDFHQIRNACSGIRSAITLHGKHWCYNNDRKTIEEIEMRRVKTGRKGVKVRCIETGVVYESVKLATHSVGGNSNGAISMVCNGKYKAPTYMGYHWEYV